MIDLLEDFLRKKKLIREKNLEQPLHNKKFDRWLIGLSGGLDSSVLFYSLIQLIQLKPELTPEKLIVAHYDHRWRPSSSLEAENLKKEIEGLQLINPWLVFESDYDHQGQSIKNCEEQARNTRFLFFEKLAKKYSSSILFLAHHRGDLRETIFKNVLEGKELAYIGGIKAWSCRGPLFLVRPFITLEKDQLVRQAQALKLSYVEDSTNKDLRFLRARFREIIEPHLDHYWPKAWRKGLNQLADYSEEIFNDLQEWTDEHVSDTFNQGILGQRFTLKELFSSKTPLYKIRFCLRQLSGSILSLGKEGSSSLGQAWIEKRRNFAYESKDYRWQMEFPYLFCLKKSTLLSDVLASHININSCNSKRLLNNNLIEDLPYGWILCPVKVSDSSCNLPKSTETVFDGLTWQDLWKGTFFIPLVMTAEDEPVRIIYLNQLTSEQQKIWRLEFQKQLVPAFLRGLVPFIKTKKGLFSLMKSTALSKAGIKSYQCLGLSKMNVSGYECRWVFP
jgi:tRNA(Ile)-lysidine synthetase-like protein